MSVARLRFYSGLVLFTYVLGHFINHALGIHSVELSLAGQKIFTAPWKTSIGLTLLIGACLIHMGLAFLSLARRRTWRMSRMEIVQYISGLSIPIIMAHHITLALWSNLAHGTTINFYGMNLLHWVIQPSSAWATTGAILVVWVHGCIGLHYNLRVRRFYEKRWPYFLIFAVVVPLGAIAGHISGGVASAARVANVEQAFLTLSMGGINREWYQWSLDHKEDITIIIVALICAVLAYRIFSHVFSRTHGMMLVHGNRSVVISPGATVLELLRDNDIPHPSICGGRGRCTTCRVRVTEGEGTLPKPEGDEGAALKRIEAAKDVRLACQIRPTGNLTIVPMLPVGVTMRQGRQKAHLAGFEQVVTCMFIDLRGSTSLSQKRLPYDVLYVLNQFFSEMSSALAENHGHYAQFNGDGLMALFGLHGKPDDAVRNAWQCAGDMLRRLDELNERLEADLPFPLEIGIGIHHGIAIVGDIGPPAVRQVSAIGDTINTTARLEAMCKTFGLPVVISKAAADVAGFAPPESCLHYVEVRGRTGKLPVFAMSGADLYRVLDTCKTT